MTVLTDMTLPMLRDLVAELGEPSYRAGQIMGWLWAKGVDSPGAMTNLSLRLRETLEERTAIFRPRIADTAVSRDGTTKFLLELHDRSLVETVLIPERDHITQCLSTQVGCALGCTFCSTGTMGFTRNMSLGEILGQITVARRYLEEQGSTLRLRNLVFMGMGEPLLNMDNLMSSLEILSDQQLMNFSSRRITVSSVGVIPALERLGNSELASLAISLHAPTQDLCLKIMPRAAKAYPLDSLMPALDRYNLRSRQRITYEYILLGGVNDTMRQAKDLVRLLGGRKAKVNLIAYNPPVDAANSPYQASTPEQIQRFQQYLMDKNLTTMLRKSKGQDIAAACGQLLARNRS